MYEITFLMQCVVDANVSWNRSIAYISFLSIKFVQAALCLVICPTCLASSTVISFKA